MEADQYGSMEVARQIWAAILQVSALRQVLTVTAIASILGIRQDSRFHMILHLIYTGPAFHSLLVV